MSRWRRADGAPLGVVRGTLPTCLVVSKQRAGEFRRVVREYHANFAHDPLVKVVSLHCDAVFEAG